MTWILFTHELKRLLRQPVTYAVGSLFLALMGLLYFLMLSEYCADNFPQAAAGTFFSVFWIPTLSTIPLLTMRSLAQERLNGTLEMMFVTQAKPIHLILAKFFSLYALYLFFWSLTLSFPYSLSIVLGDVVQQAGLMDATSLMGGYLFIALISSAQIALGIFVSSLTKSQLAAGMLCFCFLFSWIVGCKALLMLPIVVNSPFQGLSQFLQQADVFMHLKDFSHGVIDLKVGLYYLVTTFFFLYASSWRLAAHR